MAIDYYLSSEVYGEESLSVGDLEITVFKTRAMVETLFYNYDEK